MAHLACEVRGISHTGLRLGRLWCVGALHAPAHQLSSATLPAHTPAPPPIFGTIFGGLMAVTDHMQGT